MLDAPLVVAGVRFRVSQGSPTATGWDLELGLRGAIIIPSSIFFPSSAAALCITRINSDGLGRKRIQSITIPRHVQIRCSSCFSNCKSISSIEFETDSELTGIKSNAFKRSSLKSITIPCCVSNSSFRMLFQLPKTFIDFL
jgi:hypothetical protein